MAPAIIRADEDKEFRGAGEWRSIMELRISKIFILSLSKYGEEEIEQTKYKKNHASGWD